MNEQEPTLETQKRVVTRTFGVLYCGSDDVVISALPLTIKVSPLMVDDLKTQVTKKRPDGATVAQVFSGRDRMASEFRF